MQHAIQSAQPCRHSKKPAQGATERTKAVLTTGQIRVPPQAQSLGLLRVKARAASDANTTPTAAPTARTQGRRERMGGGAGARLYSSSRISWKRRARFVSEVLSRA